jgi:hypothetical protein
MYLTSFRVMGAQSCVTRIPRGGTYRLEGAIVEFIIFFIIYNNIANNVACSRRGLELDSPVRHLESQRERRVGLKESGSTKRTALSEETTIFEVDVDA